MRFVTYNLDIALFAEKELGLTLDRRQLDLLSSHSKRVILNCTRQWGKSTMAAVKAVHRALTEPGSLTLVTSPSDRQTQELVRKIEKIFTGLGERPRRTTNPDITLELANTSRVVGLPGVERTIRGFSAVSLLLVDEASRVCEDYFDAVVPFLAVGDGDIWIMSTPWLKTGFFYQLWTAEDPEWTRVTVTAAECPRISKAFLDRERRRMTPAKFNREFMAEFDESEDAVFNMDALRKQILPGLPGLTL